jgi:K+ potassium transporter
VPNHANNTTTSTEVIPAGHAALIADEELREHRPDTPTGLAGLSVAALGVVFGDIGTSPVYTFRECFNPEHGLPLDAEHVLGVLSMIFWVLIIVVAVKYVLLIMRPTTRARAAFLPCWPWPGRRLEASACGLSWSCSRSAVPRCFSATV